MCLLLNLSFLGTFTMEIGLSLFLSSFFNLSTSVILKFPTELGDHSDKTDTKR